jgi:hypothetical protein
MYAYLPESRKIVCRPREMCMLKCIKNLSSMVESNILIRLAYC